MKRVYVVYGSEASVLTAYMSEITGTIFRIYNSKKPIKKYGCIDLKIDAFDKKFNIFCKDNEITEIIFIGAAFANQSSLFLNESQESLEIQLKTNVSNYVILAKVLLPLMINRRYGRFIYLSSFRSEIVARGTSIYSASKSFGEIFFRALGVENGSFGISSTSIRMGYFDGRMLEDFTPEQSRQIKRKIGSRRLGTQEDLSGAIKFCIANDYSNGGTVELTGGISYS